MTKRILAALMAMTLCAGMAGCGITENGSSEKEDKAAVSSAEKEKSDEKKKSDDKNADKKEADAENEADGDADGDKENEDTDESEGGEKGTSEDEDSKDDDGDAAAADVSGGYADVSGELREIVRENEYASQVGNVIYMELDSEQVYRPSSEELKALIDMAMAQCQASYDGDLQKYIDLMELDSSRDRVTELTKEMYSTEDYDAWAEENHQTIKFDVLDKVVDLLMSVGSDEATENCDDFDFRNGDPSDVIKALYDSVNADGPNVIDYLSDETIWDNVEDPIPFTDKTTFVFIPDSSEKDGDDAYYEFGLMVMDGGVEYDISDVYAWKIDGRYGCIIEDLYDSTYDDEYSEMNASELFDDMLREEEAKGDLELAE